jgi:hypothetical protein
MAILPPTVTSTGIGANDPYFSQYPYDSNTSTQTYDHTINGKMFIATLNVPYDSSDESELLSKIKEDEVKSCLTEKLLRAMIEGKCVEFTKSLDPISGSYTYRARYFVTPDAQVKILRTHGVIK